MSEWEGKICKCGHKFEDHDWIGEGSNDETPGWECLNHPCECKIFRPKDEDESDE